MAGAARTSTTGGREHPARLLVAIAALTLAGCATYTTPGGAVSIPALSEYGVAEAYARSPQAQWPARVVVARVQAPGYWSASNESYGSGGFSIVTTRDVEDEDDFERLAALPGIAAVGMMNRLVVPASLTSIRDLRTAAARLRADVLLVYTLDTTFRVETRNVGPLQVIALGLLPTLKARVTSTCSAAFVDVRSGFVYGLAEASAREEQGSNPWGSHSAIDAARRQAEERAFDQALDEMELGWRRILAEHRPAGYPAELAASPGGELMPRGTRYGTTATE